MVKKGLLRGFLDQKTYKFRPADIEAYKKRLASSATSLSEGGSKGDATEAVSPAAKKKDDTSKIDLTEIDAEPEGEDKDQTSVLAPVDERGPKEKAEEAPVFQFSEKDLGLQKEEPPAVEEGDQTSLLMPAEEKPEEAKKESKPSFDFAEKDLTLPLDEERGRFRACSRRVGILRGYPGSHRREFLGIRLKQLPASWSPKSSSGESVKAPAADESESAVQPVGAATDKTVTDILGPPAEEERRSARNARSGRSG